jgi:hypothetical protein
VRIRYDITFDSITKDSTTEAQQFSRKWPKSSLDHREFRTVDG